jgi:tetratricopeptide (TPR) repeat protein
MRNQDMFRQLTSLTMAAVFAAGLSAPVAFAAGDAPKADTPAAAPAVQLTAKQEKAKKKCKADHLVWDVVHLVCKNAQSGQLDDESIYQAGRQLAMDGYYNDAITTLNYVANAQDKRVLNYLGYSYRKSGHADVGLTYYKQALAIDPDYTLVREYLGEALIQMGDITGAKGQLAEIKDRCKGACPEYAELAEHLAPFN